MALEKFRASPLAVPPSTYDQQYMTQLVRILGLYFSQLDSLTPNQAQSYRADNFYGGDFSGQTFTGDNFNGGLFTGYGRGLVLPHIAASDSTDQVAAGNNTPTVVHWNTLDSGYGWVLNAPGSATSVYAGIYKITFSLQFINTNNAVHYATVWLKRNNIDVPNSATVFAIPSRKSASPGEEGYLCGYSEATFEMNAGDVIELYWATDLAGNPVTPTQGVYMFHDAAQTTPFARPAIPSAIGSITFVSAIP